MFSHGRFPRRIDMSVRVALILVILSFIALSNAAISSFQVGPDWKHYPYHPQGTKIQFPQDEGSHSSQASTRMEWWYGLFHVAGERTAKEYTVIVAFFYETYTNKFTNVRFFHITDLIERRVISDTTYVGRLAAKKEYLDLRYEHGLKSDRWYTKRAPDGELRPFQYDLEVRGSSRHPGASIEFEMNTIKRPAIIGENGYIEIGKSGNSWYYSLTRMKVRGTLSLDGSLEAVSGIGWMDHQWGPFFLTPRSDRINSYEWFGIQLDDGEDIMVNEIFKYDQVPKDGSHGGVFWFPRDGAPGRTLDYTLERLEFWQGPWTNNYYSCKWRLIIPDRGLNLVITSRVKNQMLDFIFPFWEGRCSVTGTQTINGVKRTVRGLALAELTHSFNFDKEGGLVSSAQKTIMPTIYAGGSVEINSRRGGKSEFGEDEMTISLDLESRLRFQSTIKTQLILSDFPKRSECSLKLREAYVSYPAFLWDELDLCAGRQRIVWGTAGKIRPTDNLNPDDLSDPMNFGEKMPTNSVRVTYSLNEFTSVTGILLPTFTPATLTEGNPPTRPIVSLPWAAAMKKMKEGLTLPEEESGDPMYAFKLQSRSFGCHVSLSYFQGRDDIPIIKDITLHDVDSTTTNSYVDMVYPRIKVIGGDLAGRIGDLEVWGEVGYFIPEKMAQETLLPIGASTNEILEHPYVKYTIGGEHTFSNGVYLSGEFCHGFSDERGEDLSNFLLARVEKRLFHDKVELIFPITLEIDLERKNDPVPSSVISPEIVYHPTNAADFRLGCYLIEGKEDSKFGEFRENHEIFLRFIYSF